MNALRRTAVLLVIPLLAAACDEDDPSAPSGPVIGVNPAAVVFETSAGRDPEPTTVAITSTSEGIGLQQNTVFIGRDQGWLTATLNSANTPATLTLTPTVGELAPGSYNAVVIFTSEGAQNSPKGLSVVLRVLGGPHVFRYTPPVGAPEVTSVSIRGEMNGWGETPMTFANGTWSVTMPLDTGTYHYKFYINGSWPANMCNDETWGDPGADNWIDPRADGCRGDSDARVHVSVPPGPVFEYTPPAGAPAVTSVSLRGTMNGWGETPMLFLRKPPNDFASGSWRVTATNLNPGSYEYKFFINGIWPDNMCHDETWGHPAEDFWVDPAADGCPGGSNAVRTF